MATSGEVVNPLLVSGCCCHGDGLSRKVPFRKSSVPVSIQIFAVASITLSLLQVQALRAAARQFFVGRRKLRFEEKPFLLVALMARFTLHPR